MGHGDFPDDEIEVVRGEGVNGRHIQQEQCPECRAVCDPVYDDPDDA